MTRIFSKVKVLVTSGNQQISRCSIYQKDFKRFVMNIKILKGLFEKGLDVEEVTSEDPLAPFHHMEHFVHCSCWRLVVPDEKTPFSHFVKKRF